MPHYSFHFLLDVSRLRARLDVVISQSNGQSGHVPGAHTVTDGPRYIN